MSKWIGSKTCDICGCKIQGRLYDARTRKGFWATMCETHWKEYTNQRLGTGLGQCYEQVVIDGDFHKAE